MESRMRHKSRKTRGIPVSHPLVQLLQFRNSINFSPEPECIQFVSLKLRWKLSFHKAPPSENIPSLSQLRFRTVVSPGHQKPFHPPPPRHPTVQSLRHTPMRPAGGSSEQQCFPPTHPPTPVLPVESTSWMAVPWLSLASQTPDDL